MPSKAFGRSQRVAGSMRREVADIINNELKDPRVKLATVTEVSVNSDLKDARIYISFLTDDENEVKLAMCALEKATGFVRSQLAQRLKLRYMPNIHFVFDSLLSESMKLDALIAKGLRKD